ncbi:MAG: NFACT family protein [Clostridiales bacterium]|nr:NFACT family protein [Clostridiales bacterium]
MPLDGISTHLLAHELNSELAGARIDKIYQPSRFEVFFTIRNASGNKKLLLSCDPQSPRVQFTEVMRENPQMPPNFCMLLRKHLQGARILSVECPDFERIITISISTTDELHDTSIKKLVVEMMGRYSNIIFLNSENRIIDALLHVDNSTSRVREIMPARIYEAPPSQGKIAPDRALDMINHDQMPILQESRQRPLAKALLDSLLGFSPLLANDICFETKLDPRMGYSSLTEEDRASLISVLKTVLTDICHYSAKPTVFYIDGEPSDWHALELKDAGIARTASSLSEAMDIVHAFKDRQLRFETKRKQIRTLLSNAYNHAARKLSIHEEDIRATADAEAMKSQGELILAYQYLIQPEDKVLSIPDYPDFGHTTEIALDPTMTPTEQGQIYLKRYRKALSRREAATRFLEEERSEVAYLQSLIQAIDAANEPEDLQAVEFEFQTAIAPEKEEKSDKTSEKYHPGKAKSGKASSRALRKAAEAARSRKDKSSSRKKAEDTSSPRRYEVDGHFEVLAGRNNIQNDHLTFHVAAKNDIWFHVKNMPGTHVILRTNGKEPTEKAIVEAASIAAYFSRSNKAFSTGTSESKAEYDVRVQIDYCPVSHVKKIPKAKPGMVIYEEYNTILVSAKLPNHPGMKK